MVAPCSRVGGVYGIRNATAWCEFSTDAMFASRQQRYVAQQRKALPQRKQSTSPSEGHLPSAVSNAVTDAPGTAGFTQPCSIVENVTIWMPRFVDPLCTRGFAWQLTDGRIRTAVINASSTLDIPQWVLSH